MFSGMMPHRKEFFELLNAHADRVVAAISGSSRSAVRGMIPEKAVILCAMPVISAFSTG